MTITVVNIGTNSTIATPGSLAISVGGGGVPAASLIVLLVTDNTTTGSASDTAGNTYQVGPSKQVTYNGYAQIFFVYNSLALSSGNSITYTATSIAWSMSAFYATGIQTSSNPLDTSVTASLNNYGALNTLTSGTPSVAGELFVAMLGSKSAATTAGPYPWFVQDTADGWGGPPPTSVYDATSGGPLTAVDGGYQINSGTGTKAFTPGGNGSSTYDYASIIVGFKPAPVVASAVFRRSLSQVGTRTGSRQAVA